MQKQPAVSQKAPQLIATTRLMPSTKPAGANVWTVVSLEESYGGLDRFPAKKDPSNATTRQETASRHRDVVLPKIGSQLAIVPLFEDEFFQDGSEEDKPDVFLPLDTMERVAFWTSPKDLGIYSALYFICDKTGGWRGTVRDLAHRFEVPDSRKSMRATRDSLARLKRLGAIWMPEHKGRRGEISVLIDNFLVRTGNLAGYVLKPDVYPGSDKRCLLWSGDHRPDVGLTYDEGETVCLCMPDGSVQEPRPLQGCENFGRIIVYKKSSELTRRRYGTCPLF